jgi:hypothetical protein
MSEDPKKIPLSPLIRGAAQLLLKCAGYLDDIDAAQRDNATRVETYYAIDNDTITGYLQPERMYKYLDVFGEGETSSTVISLTFMLGEFLFTSKDPIIPGHGRNYRFILFPQYEIEFLDTLSAIRRNLFQSIASFNENAFDDMTRTFKEHEKYIDENENEAFLKQLSNIAPKIVKMFNPYIGLRAALIRNAQIPENTLRRFDVYDDNGISFSDIFNIIRNSGSYQDKVVEWVNRIRKPDKPDYLIRHDAEALATIELANEKLRPDRKQIAFITGDHYIFKAADSLKPRPDSNLSFSDLYLRHPQAFICNENFFLIKDSSIPEQSNFQLIEWLNLFFPSAIYPPHQPEGQIRRDVLRHILEGKDKSFDAIQQLIERSDTELISFRQMLDTWNRQVSLVAAQRFSEALHFARESENWDVRKFADFVINIQIVSDWSIDNLRNELLELISKLYSVTVWIGLWTHAPRKRTKGIPALRFDKDHGKVEDYCITIVRKQLHLREFSSNNLNEIYYLYRDLENTDKNLYLSHLVHALAFAAKGHWDASFTLASFALSIAESLDKKKRDHIQGREAAYLACIAKRRASVKISDIEEAYAYLKRAYEIFMQEDKENHERKDIRFTSENLAIKTRTIFYHFFLTGECEMPLLSATIRRLKLLIGYAKRYKGKEIIKCWILRQTFTNYFSLLLIARNLQKDNFVIPSDVIDDLIYFNNMLTKDENQYYHQNRYDDPYAYLIHDICSIIWAAGNEMQTETDRRRVEALEIIKEYWMSKGSYEKARIDFLTRVLNGK